MRLFLAIEPPPRVKNALEEQISGLKALHPEYSWVPKKNYHLTVFFSGDTLLPAELKTIVSDVLFDQDPFHLYVRGLDLFQNNGINVYADFYRQKQLERLVERLREADPHRVFNKQEYIPHISLARFKLPSKQQYQHLQRTLEKTDLDFSFEVKEIRLLESIDWTGQVEYKTKEIFPFPDKI